MTHKKKLSKADEEMEMAMEEMKRMNQMIAEAEALRVKEGEAPPKLPERPTESASASEASERLADALKRNANELDMQPELSEKPSEGRVELQASGGSGKRSTAQSSSDGMSTTEELVNSPLTPHSNEEPESANPSPSTRQMASSQASTKSSPRHRRIVTAARNLASSRPHSRCTMPISTVLDEPGDKGRIRNKPTWDYLVQIEPATTAYPGWMIVRRSHRF